MAGGVGDLTLTLNPNFAWEVAGGAFVASIPLMGFRIILHRMGHKGVWPFIPWALALLLGPSTIWV